MSDTNTNTPTAADLDRLKAALEAERAAHKETKTKGAERRTVYARTLGLAENANDEDIVAPLSGTDHAKAVASIQAERDELRAKVTKIEQERDAQHVESATSSALSKSGMIPANHEDAANLIRSMLTVKDGKVVTKDGVPNVIPGMDPTQLFHATVKTLRPHWWPSSVGGGAVGSRGNGRCCNVGIALFVPQLCPTIRHPPKPVQEKSPWRAPEAGFQVPPEGLEPSTR